MRGELNKETGEITAYIYKTVVADEDPIEDPVNQITLAEANELAPGVEVGSEIRIYRDTSPLGRIAAQLAKQIIFQKVREAERDTVFQEYAHREKEILNATVKRIEGQDSLRPGQGRSPLPSASSRAWSSSPSASACAWCCSRWTARPRDRR